MGTEMSWLRITHYGHQLGITRTPNPAIADPRAFWFGMNVWRLGVWAPGWQVPAAQFAKRHTNFMASRPRFSGLAQNLRPSTPTPGPCRAARLLQAFQQGVSNLSSGLFQGGRQCRPQPRRVDVYTSNDAHMERKLFVGNSCFSPSTEQQRLPKGFRSIAKSSGDQASGRQLSPSMALLMARSSRPVQQRSRGAADREGTASKMRRAAAVCTNPRPSPSRLPLLSSVRTTTAGCLDWPIASRGGESRPRNLHLMQYGPCA